MPTPILSIELSEDSPNKFYVDNSYVGGVVPYIEDYYFLMVVDSSQLSKIRLCDLIDLKIQLVTVEIDSSTLEGVRFGGLEWHFLYDFNYGPLSETRIKTSPKLTQWDLNFSIDQFVSNAREILGGYKSEYDIRFETHEIATIEFWRNFSRFGQSVQDALNFDFANLQDVINQTKHKILASSAQNQIVNNYNFPPEIREACEQYLVYFSKFLEDIGIDVETSIESSAEGSIFKVVPKNSKEALSKIKEALDIYLGLPGVPDLEEHAASFTDPGILQLLSNINHFRSQYQLAVATIQAKDATIQAKDATINSLNLTIYNQNKQLDQKDKEVDVFGGLITLKPIETKFANINWQVLFKKMKRK